VDIEVPVEELALAAAHVAPVCDPDQVGLPSFVFCHDGTWWATNRCYAAALDVHGSTVNGCFPVTDVTSGSGTVTHLPLDGGGLAPDAIDMIPRLQGSLRHWRRTATSVDAVRGAAARGTVRMSNLPGRSHDADEPIVVDAKLLGALLDLCPSDDVTVYRRDPGDPVVLVAGAWRGVIAPLQQR
jgi:hypothetical protein